MTAHATTLAHGDLTGVVRRQLRAVMRELRRARRGDARAVHQARVASRRLREALPVALPATRGSRHQAVARDVRRLGRALGAVREMDVALDEFVREGQGQPWSGTHVDRAVRDHLAAERERRAANLDAKLGRLDLKRLAERVRHVAEACAAQPAAAWLGRLAARLRQRARRLDAALSGTGTLYVPEPIHRVRIAGKKLRYTLELARASTGVPVGRQIAMLKRLQDLLGRLHDMQVLQEHVRTVAAEAVTDRAANEDFEVVQRRLEAECRMLHGQFIGRRRQWHRVADRAAARVPLLVAAGRAPRSRMLKAGSQAATPARRARTATA